MILPIITYYCTWSTLSFHHLSYSSWCVQDVEQCILHLYTLDLSTYRFLYALRNHCENMQATTALAVHRFFPSSWCWVSTRWFWAAQGVPLHEWNQMWGPGQRCRAQEPAQLPSCHRKCTGCAHLYTVPIYSPTLNNVKIEYGYYVLLHIVSYFGPPPKTHNQPMADDIFWPASCALSIIHRNT